MADKGQETLLRGQDLGEWRGELREAERDLRVKLRRADNLRALVTGAEKLLASHEEPVRLKRRETRAVCADCGYSVKVRSDGMLQTHKACR